MTESTEGYHKYIRICCSNCGYSFDVPVYCGNRFCEVCSVGRHIRQRKKLNAVISKIDLHFQYSFKHLTLTIPNCKEPRKAAISLIKSFRRLRQRSFWRNKVAGGCYVVEVTHTGHDYHVHIHAIIEAQYMPWKVLHRHWQAVSNGRGVWISKIPKIQIVKYLTKYVTKTTLNLHHQQIVSGALKGFRIFSFFGTWHNRILDIPKYQPICPHCQSTSFEPQCNFTHESLTHYKEIEPEPSRPPPTTTPSLL